MDYATQGQSTQPVAKDTIASMVNDMDRDIDRLEKLFGEMDVLGDALQGTRPRPAEPEGSAVPPPASLADTLRRKRQRLSNVIGRCEDAVMRVRNTLG